MKKGFFTSEAISQGHPDRLCDTVANTILSEALAQDPNAKVGLEALATKNFFALSGEVTLQGNPLSYEDITRDVIRQIGYDRDDYGFNYRTVDFLDRVNSQSPDIALGVIKGNETNAGDQGIMFGYASNEHESGLPLSAIAANALMFRYQEVQNENRHILSPDAKSQVTVDYTGEHPRISTIIIAASHKEEVSDLQVRELIITEVVNPVLAHLGIDDFCLNNLHVNTTGRFVVCGPASDAGVVGRKLVVDSYGGHAPIGGGCTNGKDPSKVDASAARAARHAALNLVKAGVCSECLIQLSYAIGKQFPISINVEASNLREGLTEDSISEWLFKHYDFSVDGMIKNLNLKTQDYSRLTYAGQFGTNCNLFKDLALATYIKAPSWEQANLVPEIKEFFGISE